MILLLDIGNSRLKWALHDGVALAAATAQIHGGDAAAAIAAIPARQVDAVWISQVLGTAHETEITAAVQRQFACAPHFARVQKKFSGLTVAYADTSRLGIDRWLMMLAAWRKTGTACCVVSAGTALTFDAVDAQGLHQGGFIAPGLTAMLDATLGNTRFAAAMPDAQYHAGLGADTEACVRQGAYLASLGAIERGLIAAGAPTQRYLCGGDAPLLLPQLGGGWQHRADLVLEGLLELAQTSI
ncbi:MAG: type III pantothenate kinase [Stenotrophobium sp.]